MTNLNVSDGGLRTYPLAGTGHRVSMGIGLDSRTETQPDASKVTSSSTCTPSGRLFTPTTKPPRLLPRCRGIRYPAILCRSDEFPLLPLYRLRAGGLGRFCPAITRCSLATTSTFKAAAYTALSPGSVVNSFLGCRGIWVHGSPYGGSRTTDCPARTARKRQRESLQATVKVRRQGVCPQRSHPKAVPIPARGEKKQLGQPRTD